MAMPRIGDKQCANHSTRLPRLAKYRMTATCRSTYAVSDPNVTMDVTRSDLAKATIPIAVDSAATRTMARTGILRFRSTAAKKPGICRSRAMLNSKRDVVACDTIALAKIAIKAETRVTTTLNHGPTATFAIS